MNEKLSTNIPSQVSGPNIPVEDYCVGVDLGQKRDHSVVAVIRKNNGQITLVHLKRFPLGTEYQAVIEYLKLVGERFRKVRMYYIDQTGVGESFPENARRAGIKNVKGIELSLPRKSDVMTHLKQVMEQKRLHIPRDRELIIEMNAEIAKMTEAGKTKFHHRSGTHDDRLWALALAVYCSRHEFPSYHPFVAFGHISKHPWDRPKIIYPLAGTPNPIKQVAICGTCGKPTTSNHEQYHRK